MKKRKIYPFMIVLLATFFIVPMCGVQPVKAAETNVLHGKIKQVSASRQFTMILMTDGSLWACGTNTDGQLGDGTTTNCSTPKKVMNDVAAVSTAHFHTAILKTDGSLWVCGNNKYGQLGDGTTTNRSTPKKVMTGVSAVSAYGHYTMILKTDGSLWACGSNGCGQLGDGTTTNRSIPKQVMTGVKAVSVGSEHTMIIKSDGSLWACGSNDSGQLGDGTTTNRSTPIQVMNGVSAVSAAALGHTMILKADGSLWACGNNSYGQLGDGTTINRSTPKQVTTGVATVSAGGLAAGYTMVIKTDGSLWACGSNNSGQLGDETNIDRSTLVEVMRDVSAVDAGYSHTMIIKTDGSLWACGSNSEGQLGDGTTDNQNKPKLIMEGQGEPEPIDGEDTDISQLDNTLYINNVECFAGKELTLSVRMKNTVQVEGFNFDLYLPDGVSVLTDEEGYPEVYLSTERTTARKTNTFEAMIRPDGSLRVFAGSTNGSTISGNDGEVATVKVKIDKDMEAGSYPIVLKEISIADNNAVSHDVNYVKSTLVVNDYLPGDANGDGKINVADYTAIVHYYMGNTPANFNEKAADANQDGKINVADYTAVVHMYLYGSINSSRACSPRKTPTDISSADNIIYIEPTEVEPGEKATLSVKMKNSVSIEGFNFDLYLPDGMSFAVDSEGFPETFLSSERTTARKTNTFESAIMPDGSLRVFAGSTNGSTISGNDGEVAQVTINVSNDLATGTYPLILRQIALADTQANSIDTEMIECAITVTQVNSGITDIVTTLRENTTVYSLSGQRLAAPKKGINIVNGKKVVVK